MSYLAVKRAWSVLTDDERSAVVGFLHKDKQQNLVDLSAALKGLDEVVQRDGAEAEERAALERKRLDAEAAQVRKVVDRQLTARELEVSAKEGALAERARALKEREEAVERREKIG